MRHFRAERDVWLLLLVIAFSLHNVEEFVFDLPGWMTAYASAAPRMGASSFSIAIVLITLVSWVVYVLHWLWPQREFTSWLVALMSASLLANCLSHVGLSFASQSLMPGVYSAIFFLGPLSSVVLLSASRRLRLGKLSMLLLLVLGAAIQFLITRLLIALGSNLAA